MKTVWKYELTLGGPCTILMPRHAEILDVQAMGLDPGDNPNIMPTVVGIFLWAVVDPFEYTEERKFVFFETGKPLLEPVLELLHIKTLVLQNGHYVLHVFEDRQV